ncbi:hypothetical protein CesoFtcFv8_004769 [Champsocephalus esox]|uniref:Reverse transcriptase domain-containing protein n=1 Tax=Champsocephalus esox TaxID=159716 RepID=A0AAN8H8Z1_9TELE|nr:hypothetical protein CesoFtcFv8_004769 [Champsocephalus esox]
MSAHHLKLNLDKTELLFLPGKDCPTLDLTINIGNSVVSPTQTARNLGVILDNKLSFTGLVFNLPTFSQTTPLLRWLPCVHYALHQPNDSLHPRCEGDPSTHQQKHVGLLSWLQNGGMSSPLKSGQQKADIFRRRLKTHLFRLHFER